MKKKSASKSAFFNLRVLIGLCIALAGISLALVALDAFAANSAPVKIRNHIITASNDPLVPVGFDCSKIEELGIDKHGELPGRSHHDCLRSRRDSGYFFCRRLLPTLAQAVKKLLVPLYGAGDVNLITGTETSPNITQSETFTWANPDNPQQVVVAYNDSRGRNASPINISGASVSTDGGATFTRLTTASGQSPFANTFGDPVVLYNAPTPLGSPSGWTRLRRSGPRRVQVHHSLGPASWTHFCVHTGGSDDRESGWADNNPASPFCEPDVHFLERLCFGGRASSSPSPLTTGLPGTRRYVTTTFIRNVQITGDKVTGDVYIAGMDEMGGGLTNRANKIYRSTDGGNTWTNTYTGPTFAGPGRSASGFFATHVRQPRLLAPHGLG